MKTIPAVFCCALLFGTILSTACEHQLTANDSKQNINRMASIEHNKELARRWILEGWNQNRNKEIIGDIFAENWIDGNPAFPDQPKGLEGAQYFVEVYRNIFPDIQFALTHLIADENFVTFRFTAEATHRGELMGIPPTGKRVKISGIVIHRVENGKFAESWNEIDLLGVRQQLLSD